MQRVKSADTVVRGFGLFFYDNIAVFGMGFQHGHPSKQDCLSLFIVRHFGLRCICSSLLSVCLTAFSFFFFAFLAEHSVHFSRPLTCQRYTQVPTSQTHHPHNTVCYLFPRSQHNHSCLIDQVFLFLLGFKQALAEKLLTDLRCVEVLE